MILITQKEAEFMREKGFGRYISVSSQTHKSRAKRNYLTENPRALEQLYQYRESVKVKLNE